MDCCEQPVSMDVVLDTLFPMKLDNLPEEPDRATYEATPVRGLGRKWLLQWGWNEGCGLGPNAGESPEHGAAIAYMEGLVENGRDASGRKLMQGRSEFARHGLGAVGATPFRDGEGQMQDGGREERTLSSSNLDAGHVEVEAHSEGRKARAQEIARSVSQLRLDGP